MKKMGLLFSVLPGGFAFLATMVFFTGCARFQYETSAKHWIRGVTASPETVMMAQAEAHAIRTCADDPTKCRAAEVVQAGQWGGMYGAGMMDTPIGYTWAGIRAAGGGEATLESGDNISKGIADIKKKVNAMDKGQDAFFQALTKNKKKGN